MSGSYGRRLTSVILHQVAHDEPQRTFAVQAKSNDLEQGFLNVSFLQVARAVNHVANWLQSRFESGQKPPLHDTLAYIGVPDLRYNILFYAAVQCGYKVFLPSPRNPAAVNISLFEQTQCVKLVHSPELTPVAQVLQQAAGAAKLQCEQLPSLDELLTAPEVGYTCDFDRPNVLKEPVLILHSSGSTGLPKPVVHTHGTLATYDVRDLPTVPGRMNHDALGILRFPEPESRIYDVFPPFHIAGFMTKIMVPVFNLTVPIFGPPIRPPSGALALDIIRQHKPRGVVLPPTVAEQLYHEPGGAQLLRQVDVLLFAGGPLAQAVGDEIVKHTMLCQFYGSTEAGQIRQLMPSSEDWAYMQFNPIESFQMQPVEGGMSELVLQSDSQLERTSALYHNYPDIGEWRTKDLFAPHPTKPGLWKFHARRDDILVLSSGEKLNPIPMEIHITVIEGISGALVVGSRQPHAALLVELGPNAAFSSDPREDIWPAVELGNALLPAHGRIAKSMIIVANPEKPFARAGKGTVVRRLTEDLYAAEIKLLYDESNTSTPASAFVFKPSAFSENDVKGLLRSVLGSIGSDLTDQDNFYIHGIDSVRTIEAVGQLRNSLRPYKSADELKMISIDVLYRYPTIEQLARVLLRFLNHGEILSRRNRSADLQAAIKEHTEHLAPNTALHRCKTTTGNFAVAVTGTTGYLGSLLLNKLSQQPNISRIYCLNRSPVGQTKYEKKYGKCPSHIEFLQVDMSMPNLGLDNERYNRLLHHCNAIIHNAWTVDFNLALQTFKDSLQSVQHFVKLSNESELRPRIFFVSSISATGIWAPVGAPRQTVPQCVVDTPDAPIDIGYAESKFVAEHILHAASGQSGIPVTILRMGQIAPSSRPTDHDTWPTGDAISVYLRTCRELGAQASDFVESMDWVPVDWAASAVTEILLYDYGSNTQDERVYNIVHPHPQPWSFVTETLQEWCGEGTKMVNMQQWVDMLREADDGKPSTHERLPALRMLKIYELIAKHGPTHAYDQRSLMALHESARLPAASAELLKMWLKGV